MTTLWDKFEADNPGRILIGNTGTSFRNGDNDIKEIKDVLKMAYNGSEFFRDKLDAWVSNNTGPFTINFVNNNAYVKPNFRDMLIDVQLCDSLLYTSNTGKAIETTLEVILIHELMHILTGTRDNGVGTRYYDTTRSWDYRGENMIFSNIVYSELGIIKENSYICRNERNVLVANTDYTNGNEIDRSITIGNNFNQEKDWDTSHLGTSRDLLFGNNEANILASGAGNDFLYGMGENDHLYGGEGDDVIYGDDKENLLTGNDHLYGGSGTNHLYGGNGHDTYYIGEGYDIIEDFDSDGVLTWHNNTNNSILSGIRQAFKNAGSIFIDDNNLKYILLGNQMFIFKPDGTVMAKITDFDFNNNNYGLNVINKVQPEDIPLVKLPGTNPGTGTDIYHTVNSTSSIKDSYVGIKTGIRHDIVTGGYGNEIMDLDAGNDYANGSLGNDVIDGGDGNDVLLGSNFVENEDYADNDADKLKGGKGRDLIFGGIGNDIIVTGTNQEEGGASDGQGDWACGGTGNDFIFGSKDDDFLQGGAGEDFIYGGNGNDIILGDGNIIFGSRTMPAQVITSMHDWNGSAGTWKHTHNMMMANYINSTSFNWSIDITDDQKPDFQLTTQIAVRTNERWADGGANDIIYGGDGNDWIAGQTGDDFIDGGTGNDIIYGEDVVEKQGVVAGNNFLVGGAGSDKIYGGAGNDALYGDTMENPSGSDGAKDFLYGGSGNDILYAGTGGDELYGEDDNDILIAGVGTGGKFDGGSGNDILVIGSGNNNTFEGGSGVDIFVINSENLTNSTGQDILRDSDGNWQLQINGIILTNYNKHAAKLISKDKWHVGDISLTINGYDLLIQAFTKNTDGSFNYIGKTLVLEGGAAHNSFTNLGWSSFVGPIQNTAPIVANPISTSLTLTASAYFEFIIPQNTFTDADGDVLTIEFSNLPSWLSFNSSTNKLYGTSPEGFEGNLNLQLKAFDGKDYSPELELKLIVEKPSVINNKPEVNGIIADVNLIVGEKPNLNIPTNVFKDADGDTLQYAITLNSVNGSETLNGLFNYDEMLSALEDYAWLTGDYTVSLKAFDGTDYSDSSVNFNLKVEAANNAPTLNLPHEPGEKLNLSVQAGEKFEYVIDIDSHFSDVDGDKLSLLIEGLPAWATYDASTNTISGMAPNNIGDFYDFQMKAYDGALYSEAMGWSIYVTNITPNTAPVLVGDLSDLTITAGKYFEFTVSNDLFFDAENDEFDVMPSFLNLPSWLKLNFNTNTIYGTPPEDFDGKVTIEVFVTDYYGNNNTYYFDIIVPPVAIINNKPKASGTVSDVNLIVGEKPNLNIPTDVFKDADGDTLQYAITLNSVNGSETLGGLFTYEEMLATLTDYAWLTGDYTVSLKAFDGKDYSDSSVNFNLKVEAANNAPTIEGVLNNLKLTTGESFSFIIPENTFTDADGDSLTLFIESLPSWVNFNSLTNTLSGVTPAVAGSYKLGIKAFDGTDYSENLEFNIIVSKPWAPGDKVYNYNYNFSDGLLIINNQGQGLTYQDIINFGTGINADDLMINRERGENGLYNDLVITFKNNTHDKIIIENHFSGNDWCIDFFEFAEGTKWNNATINAKFDYNYIEADVNGKGTGSSGKDLIVGFDNNDTLSGGAGNDILDGGSGDDILNGGKGNNTYVFGKGYGHDIVNTNTAAYSDRIETILLKDLNREDITFGVVQNGAYQDFVITINETGETIKVAKGGVGYNSGMYWINDIKFADGTTMSFGDAIRDGLHATDGDDVISLYVAGGDEHYTLYGGKGNDILKGNSANDQLFGEDGNDTLSGEAGDDILDGGSGDDILNGGKGNNTYVFGKGYGHDIVNTNTAAYSDRIETILLKDLNREDITFGVVQNGAYQDFVITINETGETIKVAKGGVGYNSGMYWINDIKFADGTTMSFGDAIRDGLHATDGDDVISLYVAGGDEHYTLYGGKGNDILKGNSANDQLFGEDGNDTLSGEAGDDILDGGSGDDILNGGKGNNTYVFGKGYGHDIVNTNTAAYSDRIETILLKDLNREDITFGVVQNGSYQDFVITINETGETIKVAKGGVGYNSGMYWINNIKFVDGTTMSFGDAIRDGLHATDGDDVISLNITGGDEHFTLYGGKGNDILKGNSANDQLFGEDGNDTLSGEAGDDILDGGSGNDTLTGGGGDDTYIYGKNYGQDTINNFGGGNDTLNMADFNLGDLNWTRSSNHLVISVLGSEDKVTVNNWFATGDYKVDSIQVGSNVIIENEVAKLVEAMASFGVPQGAGGYWTEEQKESLGVMVAPYFKPVI